MAEAVQGRARKCARRPKKWAAKNSKYRVWTLVCSDWRVGVRVIAEEFNMNTETVRQIVKKIWEWEKFPQKWCLESWHMTRNNVGFTFHLIFYTMQRCLIGSFPAMKCGVFYTTWKQNNRACSGKHRIHLGRKSMHVSVAGQEHACVFLRPQGDSSLWIHSTRANGKSTVLFGSADKITEMCSEVKSWNLPR
jgi:hypothetical protein